MSKDTKIKVSQKLSGREYSDPQTITTSCMFCGVSFSYTKHYTSKKNKQCCSKVCSAALRGKQRKEKAKHYRSEMENYRRECQFSFSLKDYPQEFDFTLVEQYGWYKAKNKGNNLNGVSRDHMISIVFGFENVIPAEHIRHPANCQLMRHSDNVSKNSKSSITYDQLLLRIEEWEQNYSENHPKNPIISRKLL